MVTDTSDNPSDTGSLWYAINQANADNQANTIVFGALFNTPQTITLAGAELELSDTTGTQTISGPAAGVTINANQQSRVFQLDVDVTASLSGLTITGGLASPNGGGVYSFGTATLTDCTISGNSTPREAGITAGGLDNVGGTMNLTRCTISNNYGRNGGGLANHGGTATLVDCTISGNLAGYTGGVLSEGTASSNAVLNMTNCTVNGNYAAYEGGGVFKCGTATLTIAP